MTNFLDILDGPKRPDMAFAPGPVERDATAYAAAALAGEVANLLAVPIGSGRNDQLNRSAFKMGGLVAAGAIDARTVTEHLGAADGGLDYKATRDTIASGLRKGMEQARAIPDRKDGTEWSTSARPDTDSLRSDDPFSDYYSAGDSGNSAPRLNTSGSTSMNLANSTGGNGSASGPNGSPNSTTGTSLAEWVHEHLPLVDWFKLWTERVEIDWILFPILPARRGVVIYSPPKVGKSLLMLELAYHISRGTAALGSTPPRAFRVLYVDFENDMQGDILPRLTNMGAEPMQLDNLAYLTLPTLAGLDTEKGALELLAAVQAYACEVVIIDTVSRAVDGDENENDTWLSFYRRTGLRLKQAGVAMIRLDHTGKDETKGQRGGSAKGGDVDAVWRLSKVTEDTFRLVCDMNRFPLPAGDKLLTLVRREGPLRHEVNPLGSKEAVIEAIIEWCDREGVSLDAGFRKVLPGVKLAGIDVGQDRCVEALRLRRARAGLTDEVSGASE